MSIEDLKKQIPDIFEKVKKDVKTVFGRQRAGLTLGLADMGMFQGGFIGGMHFHPGTDIVMNKTPLKMILEKQPSEVVWGYVYHILLHEYIHSLGILDEKQCRMLTLEVTEKIFNENDHPAMIFAKKGIGAYFPDLRLMYIPPERRPDGIKIEYLKEFDRNSFSYYS
ncbi:MAG: hypothetical protein P8Y70_04445 [Candidatus Lokiarchaeota archaeon]